MKKLLALSLILLFGCMYPVCARNITHDKHVKSRATKRAEATSHKGAAAAKINYNENSNSTTKSNFYIQGALKTTTSSKEK